MALLHLSRQPVSTTTGWRYWVCSCNSGRPIKPIRPSTFLFHPPSVHNEAFKKISVNKENFVSSSSDSGYGNGCASYVHVPSSFLAAEKVEVEAMLSLFLAKRGLSMALTSDRFINHLLWKLHSLQKSRYLEQGREQLSAFEIQETLIPYLESLLVEKGDFIYNLFPKLSISPSSTELLSMKIKRKQKNNKLLKAVARVCEKDSEGDLLPQVLYLIEIGMKLNQIKDITRKFPPFAFYNLDRKIKPTIEFLLGLGISQADIPTILSKRPQLFGISLSNNLIPTMAYLEGFGVDKTQWAKIIYKFPAFLTFSRQKVRATIDYFSELGLSEGCIGKILTRFPHIISYNVDDKLRPTSEYFHSLGFDVANVMRKCPQVFGLSLEGNLKPITGFFVEKGFTDDEIQAMISKYGTMYSFSLAENIIPKWEFFLTMDYDVKDLVKFPHYFGYSLEGRIKPRWSCLKESGVPMILSQLLSISDANFLTTLHKKAQRSVV